MTETIPFKAPEPGRRRRLTLQQKRALLEAAELSGASISSVAREHGLHASMLFQWRRAMENGEEKGLESGEEVVPASKLKEAGARIRDLERALGRKTMENEILQEAVKIGREKTHLARGVAKTGSAPRPECPHNGKVITLRMELPRLAGDPTEELSSEKDLHHGKEKTIHRRVSTRGCSLDGDARRAVHQRGSGRFGYHPTTTV